MQAHKRKRREAINETHERLGGRNTMTADEAGQDESAVKGMRNMHRINRYRVPVRTRHAGD